MRPQELFFALFNAETEDEVDEVIRKNPESLGKSTNWSPLAGNENNFGVIENQQSSPIAALIEKITNSIDAILMRKCLEAGIDLKSDKAPKTMDEAIQTFFKAEHTSWHLPAIRQQQAEEIQILADGPRKNTSLIIYDNGLGQHPDDFEKTFLSLIAGNKNEIQFVQGKYNMGGTGAIVFCGKKRYQLLASKKYDGSGEFGFTLVRRHPLAEHEMSTRKGIWYEFFKLGGKISKFPITELDLGLKGRTFKTGTILKLYSYDLPSGSRSVISRDLNQSLNEYLFEPALPVYTIDKEVRYPDDKNLARDLFGLKRRLEHEKSKYVEEYFSETHESQEMGKLKITCYVFKGRIEGKDVKESKESIEREFFKNNMAVLFSMNGQVHGFLSNAFITQTLKMTLLKNYLLINVDCTQMKLDFRNELFMASRDRLKDSDETRHLRALVAEILIKSRLSEINKKRKDSFTIEGGDTSDLLKAFTKSMPFNQDLMKLLNNTFKIDLPKEKSPGQTQEKEEKEAEKLESFIPKRFPTFFKLVGEGDRERPAAKIPLGTARTIRFLTDAEDQYFDRTQDPGDLKISLLSFAQNSEKGGKSQGSPKQLSGLLNIRKSSPSEGRIRLTFAPTKDMQVGDLIQMQAILDGPGVEFEERFWIKIVDKEKPQEKTSAPKEEPQSSAGLPQFRLAYKEEKDAASITWEKLAESGISMGYENVMHPFIEDQMLSTIFINMDSNVLKTYKSKVKNISEEQLQLADKKYISSVYFHTLFLFAILKNKKYEVQSDGKDVDLTDFLKVVFETYYSEFLLNFGTEQLMASLEI
jgi:hypothetical protein